MKFTFQISDREYALPGKYEVCPRCHGNGSHVNPAIDGNGLSREDFEEQGPDFYEDYMSGVYDVRCESCKGERVVLVPDRGQIRYADAKVKAIFRMWLQSEREEAEYRALCEAERKAGC